MAARAPVNNMNNHHSGVHIVLDHDAFNSDPQLVCKMACVCKAWRDAIQHCSISNISVSITKRASLGNFSSFAAWLPKNARMVSSISLGVPKFLDDIRGVRYQDAAVTLLQLLQFSMQLAAASCSAAESQPSVQPLQPQWQQRRLNCWQLRSFNDSCVCTPAVLSTLPPHSLTQLQLDCSFNHTVHGPALSAALGRLCSLQDLSLRCSNSYRDPLPKGCLSGISNLQQLTRLELHGELKFDEVHQLFQQPLPLKCVHLSCSEEGGEKGPQLDLSRLAHLEEMQFDWSTAMAANSKLPTQLKRLNFNFCTEDNIAVLHPLKQLQQLTLIVDIEEPDEVELLVQQLPHLQQLSLRYNSLVLVEDHAPSWQRLPVLRGLHMEKCYDRAMSTSQFQSMMQNIAAASNLVHLQLFVNVAAAEAASTVAVCSYLTGLSKLESLAVQQCMFPFGCIALCQLQPRDVMQLSVLTGLTHLAIQHVESGVADLAASALACSLTGLRSLQLNNCALGDCACISPIAKLTGLTRLSLSENHTMTDEELMLLTALTSLKELEVLPCRKLSHDAEDRFWAAMRQQQGLHL